MTRWYDEMCDRFDSLGFDPDDRPRDTLPPVKKTTLRFVDALAVCMAIRSGRKIYRDELRMIERAIEDRETLADETLGEERKRHEFIAADLKHWLRAAAE